MLTINNLFSQPGKICKKKKRTQKEYVKRSMLLKMTYRCPQCVALFLIATCCLYTANTSNITCETLTIHSNNYSETKPSLVIATFITLPIHGGNFLELFHLIEPPRDFNTIYIIYHYPRHNCSEVIMESFLDASLNEHLLNRRPFKITAIITTSTRSSW